MPFPMKIQPIDFNTLEETALPPRSDTVKSLFKRLFERPFPSVLRNSTAEKIGTAVAADELPLSKECAVEFEPSSVCLAKMVQNFMEENNNEKQQSCAVRCSGRNCFNGNCSDGSDEELDGFFSDSKSNLPSSTEASEILKSLVCPMSASDKILLADTTKIMEKHKICKSKDDFSRKIVTDELLTLGYNASICKSCWEKSPSYPAGEYEYIDVIIQGERLLIDIDFRSEFELARSTKNYKLVLQMLPLIFVGKADRLQKIIVIVSEAVKQCLKKKGMHIPPWRKFEYIKAKWLSPYNRFTASPVIETIKEFEEDYKAKELSPEGKNSFEDAELREPMFDLSESSEEEWKPPEINPRSSQIGVKIVTGLASAFED